jgi:hypothetical protein
MGDGEAHLVRGMVEAVEVVVEKDGVAADCFEVVEDPVAALDGEVAYAEGGVGGGEEGVVEEGEHGFFAAEYILSVRFIFSKISLRILIPIL